MKHTTLAVLIISCSLVLGGCTAERYSRYDRDRSSKADTLAMMKTQDVISMSKAGVNDSLIMTMLAVSNSWFQLKPQEVIDLKNAGVSDKVIDAMIESTEPSSARNGSDEGGYYYPPYYWYAGYYPYWYYPSFYLGYGFQFYHSSYGHRVMSHGSYFGHYGGRSGSRGSGRRR